MAHNNIRDYAQDSFWRGIQAKKFQAAIAIGDITLAYTIYENEICRKSWRNRRSRSLKALAEQQLLAINISPTLTIDTSTRTKLIQLQQDANRHSTQTPMPQQEDMAPETKPALVETKEDEKEEKKEDYTSGVLSLIVKRTLELYGTEETYAMIKGGLCFGIATTANHHFLMGTINEWREMHTFTATYECHNIQQEIEAAQHIYADLTRTNQQIILRNHINETITVKEETISLATMGVNNFIEYTNLLEEAIRKRDLNEELTPAEKNALIFKSSLLNTHSERLNEIINEQLSDNQRRLLKVKPFLEEILLFQCGTGYLPELYPTQTLNTQKTQHTEQLLQPTPESKISPYGDNLTSEQGHTDVIRNDDQSSFIEMLENLEKSQTNLALSITLSFHALALLRNHSNKTWTIIDHNIIAEFSDDNKSEIYQSLTKRYLPNNTSRFLYHLSARYTPSSDTSAATNPHNTLIEDNLTDTATTLDFTEASALHLCSQCNRSDTLQSLLENGADPNQQDKKGRTPLIVAADYGDIDSIDVLLRYRANSTLTAQGRLSALHSAVSINCPETVTHLINDIHISINARDDKGFTPLHFACELESPTIVNLLMQHPLIEVDALKNNNSTPLLYPASVGNLDIVTALINNNANIYATNSQGYNPLIIAALQGHKDIVLYMLRATNNNSAYASNTRMVQQTHSRVLKAAAGHGHSEIIQLMLEQHPHISHQINNQHGSLLITIIRIHNALNNYSPTTQHSKKYATLFGTPWCRIKQATATRGNSMIEAFLSSLSNQPETELRSSIETFYTQLYQTVFEPFKHEQGRTTKFCTSILSLFKHSVNGCPPYNKNINSLSARANSTLRQLKAAFSAFAINCFDLVETLLAFF